MTESLTSAAQSYKFVPYGGGIEELDRFGVRDRIRAGDITAETELAIVGTDLWRAASTYPELGRYFEIAATLPRTMPGLPITPAKPRQVEPMKTRVISGLAYPLAGGEVLMLVGLAVLSVVPVLARFAPLASTLIMVDIIRTSAEGRTKMPLVDTSQMWQLVRTYMRVMFVTIVALLPVIAFGVFAFGAVLRGAMSPFVALLGLLVTLAFGAIYYPACLATVAVWDSILDSLNPAYVVRVIRRMGVDYFIVVGTWFVATATTTFFSSPWFSPAAMIPIVGTVFANFLSFWALFYVSHLLGYAVYRHAPELGWE